LEEVVRINEWSPILKIGEEKFEGNRMFLAENNFFRVFSTKMIKGDPETVLKDLNSIILSRTVSSEFFGIEDPMGKKN
jgi:putative ABC transport system permease protein